MVAGVGRETSDEKIEAWSNGPVVRDLFEYHRGKYYVSGIEAGDSGKLDADQKATVDMALKHYGDKPAYWLVRLSHSEPPWIEARGDLSPTESSDAEITLDSMAQYYSSLLEIDIESWKATAEEMAAPDMADILTESKRKIEADEVIPWEEVKREFDMIAIERGAKRSLESRIDTKIAESIIARIDGLQQDPHSGKPLKGPLKGKYRLTVAGLPSGISN